MADRPIIFSRPMIMALLDGRKQTRRLIRDAVPDAPTMDNVHPNHKPRHPAPYLDAYCGERKTAANPRGMGPNWCWWTRDDRPGSQFRIGYVPGDRLWVREAWAPLDALTHNDPGTTALIHRGFYRADEGTVEGEVSRWRPSIHMPRRASRLTLTVTDVRVQRLQEISEEDAVAEGLIKLPASGRYVVNRGEQYAGLARHTACARYADLWCDLHGSDAWDANPFVAAVSFSVERRNIDALREAA